MSQFRQLISVIVILLGLSLSAAQEAIYFEVDSSELHPNAIILLDFLVHEIKSSSDFGELKIIGHTDSDGSLKYNKNLSLERSMTVLNYLYSKNISNRIHVISKGELEPVNDNSSKSSKSKNRRVQFLRSEKNVHDSFQNVHTQTFNIYTAKDTVIIGDKGTKIIVSKSIFKDIDPGIQIEIQLQEFYDKSSFVMNKLTTLTTSNSILESRGMIHIKAIQSGRELQLKDSGSFEILFKDRLEKDGTEIFYGSDRGSEKIWDDKLQSAPKIKLDSFLSRSETVTTYQVLINEKGIITDTLSTEVKIIRDSIITTPEERYNNKISSKLLLKSTRLGWINCDRFWEDIRPKRDIYVEIEEDFDPVLSLVFKSINAVLPYSYRVDNKYVFRNIPINEDIEIIGINKTELTPTIQFARIAHNTSCDTAVKLKFQHKAYNTIKLELKNL
jgi:hypothetical protein